MQPSPIRATGSYRAVVFDGTTVTLTSRNGRRVLEIIPLDHIVAVTLKQQWAGGYLELHRSTGATVRDRSYFQRTAWPAFEQLAVAIDAQLERRPSSGGWNGGHAVVPRPAVVRESFTERWLMRLTAASLLLYILPIALGGIAALAIIVACMWRAIAG